MGIIKWRYVALLLVFTILVATVCLPVKAANTAAQNVAVTKLVDESNYKKTLFVITTNDTTYHIIVQAKITVVGSETLMDLNATLYNPANETITASARTPDTFSSTPFYNGPVNAFDFHLSASVVNALKSYILPVVIVLAIVLQVFAIITGNVPYYLLAALETLVLGGPFIYASLPWILLTLLQYDNADGSFDMYVPTSPSGPLLTLLFEEEYFVATGSTTAPYWWEIVKQEVYTDISLPWWLGGGVVRIVWFTYFAAYLYSTPHTPPSYHGPKADFWWTPTQPTVNENITFASTSSDPDGNITAYQWSLGDGGQETTPSFVYKYTLVNDYNVTLTVTDNHGLTNSTTQTVSVNSGGPFLNVYPYTLEASVAKGQNVTAQFEAVETSNQTDLTNVSFQASDLTNYFNNATISSGNITFDRNAITITKGTYANVSVTFNATSDTPIGVYSGNITITSDKGGNKTVFTYLTVYGPPIANFTWSPLTPSVVENATFDASSSIPGGNPIVDYEWNFGDGQTASGLTAMHNYTNATIYTVTLNVTDSKGLWDTTQAQVQVIPEGVHEVNVTNITAPEWVYKDVRVVRDCANISVTVSNLGNFPEDAWVTLYYDIAANKSIGAYPVHLEIGQSYTLLFIWNTVDVPCGNYTLTAVATIPTGSNTFTDGNITIRLPGDSNGDGSVNLKDIALVARAFGSTPGSPRWNAALDLNSDGVINMQDIALVARHFGQHYP